MGDIGKAGGITGAVFGGANALMKLGLGIKQLIDGKKIQKKLDAQGRPLETTPEAFNETEALVRSNYLNGKLAGQTQLTDQITSQGANQIQNIQQTAGSGADALMAYNVANNNTQRNLNELGIKAAQNQQNNFQQLLNALGQKAAFQQSQFQNNVMTPYMQQAQQAQALKQGGLNNLSNAFNDAGNIAMGVGNTFNNSRLQNAQMDALESGKWSTPQISQMQGGFDTGVSQIGNTGQYTPISNLIKSFMFRKGQGSPQLGFR